MGKKRLFNADERRFRHGYGDPKPCETPKESEVTGVCTCGSSLSKHRIKPEQMKALPYAEAIWKWMLKEGGFFSYYGGYEESQSEDFLRHLQDCELDYGKSGVPEPGKEREFNGTFTDTELYVDVVAAYPVCKCGEYDGDHWRPGLWGIRSSMTIGEIIFQVVKAGETP